MAFRKAESPPSLTRRERQIMDVIYAPGRATAAEVREGIDDAPSYSAVRALLRLLEEKGHLTHEQEGPRYVHLPTTSRRQAGSRAGRHLVETFFGGSVEEAVTALIDANEDRVNDEVLERLANAIVAAKKEGR